MSLETEISSDPRLRRDAFQLDQFVVDEPRRVVLVVKEREGVLLLDRFFLVTSISRFQMNGDALLEDYRQRDKAEGHVGELMDVPAPPQSSTNRPKTHLRGKTPKPAVDAFACIEVRLLIAMLVYQTMHAARRAVVRATGSEWSLRRLRACVLRGGGPHHLGPPHVADPRRSLGAILGVPLAADPDPARCESMNPRER